MNLAVLTTYPPIKCGIAEYSYDLTRSLLEVNPKINITVYRVGSVEDNTLPANQYDLSKINIIDTKITIENVKYDKLAKLFNENYDVIHIQHEYNIFPCEIKFIQFLDELRKYCDKLIITLHTVKHSLWYPGIDKFQRKIAEKVDVIVVHSVLQEMELIHQRVDPNKIIKIPHGTRIARIVSKEEAIVKLNLPIKESDNVLLLQGFLRQDKGLNIAVEAFSRLIKDMNNIVLIIAGQVQFPQHNEKYVREVMVKISELSDKIIIMNKYLTRNEVDLVYSISDIILFPYVDVNGDIGVSGALHWALGSFKPLICSKTPRLVEYYQYVPKLVFPPQNADLLVEKIKYVLSHYDEVLEYIGPIIDYAIETSWINIAKQHLKLYNNEDPYLIDVLHSNVKQRVLSIAKTKFTT